MPATLRHESCEPRSPEGYVQENLQCNRDGCSARYVMSYHEDELRAEREGDPKAYPPGSTHETVLQKMREKAGEVVEKHHGLHEARDFVWAGLEKGWVVVEDLTAAGL
jgi:superfamily II DNA helicase RecQ